MAWVIVKMKDSDEFVPSLLVNNDLAGDTFAEIKAQTDFINKAILQYKQNTAKPEPKVISWDWKASISIPQLQHAVGKFGATVISVDTGADEYAVVVGASGLTREQADEVYKKHCEEQEVSEEDL